MKKISKRATEFFKDHNNRILLSIKYKDSFIDMNRLKFPVINPYTGKFDCLIANQSKSHALLWVNKKPSKLKIPDNYYKNIVNKIDKLIIKNKCVY